MNKKSTADHPHKRNRPRHRKPYRDNVLTVPATPERFVLEESRIRETYRRQADTESVEYGTRIED